MWDNISWKDLISVFIQRADVLKKQKQEEIQV